MSNYFEVEKILSKRTKPKVEYLVKWDGWDYQDATWEPIENLLGVLEMVDEYENSKNSKKEKTSQNKFLSKKRKEEPIELTSDEESLYSQEEVEEIENIKNKKSEKKEKRDKEVKLYIDEKDKAEKIKSAKEIDGKIAVLVEFKIGKNGRKTSWVFTDVLANTYPKLLIKYYEKNLKFKN